ncbi:MAG: 50S ribosomal protein L20 [Candidatus Tagabacteria bacterium]
MTRVKRGIISMKRRRKILKQTKGFRWGRKSKERLAKEALLHAGIHRFHDLRKKKGNFRRLWQIKINAGARQHGLSYSVFMNKLKKANIGLNRKILAELAEHYPQVFEEIIKKVK